MLSFSTFYFFLVVSSGPILVLSQDTLGSDSLRSSQGTFDMGSSGYNYAPAIIEENGLYRMWWCGDPPDQAIAGDHILYAQSSSLDGPWTSQDGSSPWQIVFAGTGTGSFDNKHTCDPSVVKAGSTYYLFYGAEQDDGLPTTMGVASGSDGINWTRLNNDQPIVTQAGQQSTGNTYGAGQPSVALIGDEFYMVFTDTTGAGSDPTTGNSQFVWRSADVTFQTNVEVWTSSGWQAKTDANSRSLSVATTASTDWQYSDVLDAFILAQYTTAGETTLSFLDPQNLSSKKYADVNIPGNFTEGPGIVSRTDKHSVAGTECGRVPVDIIRSTTGKPPTGLGHIGVDVILDGATC